MRTQELIAATSPTIGAAGAAFYFHPMTLAKGKSLKLDGFRFYMLGRGGVLGDVEADVVASSFGYFTAISLLQSGIRPKNVLIRAPLPGYTWTVVPTWGDRRWLELMD